MGMKQNLTLSINKELIQKARVLAAQRQVSISQMVSRELARIVTEAERYEAAKRRAQANTDGGLLTTEKRRFANAETLFETLPETENDC